MSTMSTPIEIAFGATIHVENDWHGRTEAVVVKSPFMIDHNGTPTMVAMVFFIGHEGEYTVQWGDGNWQIIDSSYDVNECRTDAMISDGPFVVDHNGTPTMVAFIFFTGCDDGDTVQWVDGNWKTIESSDDLYNYLPWLN